MLESPGPIGALGTLWGRVALINKGEIVFKVLGAIVFLLAWFGFVGPACVSATSDVLVVGWFLSTAAGAAVALKIVALAEAEARANAVRQQSITPALLELEKIKKWDGKLPQVTGGATPYVNLK